MRVAVARLRPLAAAAGAASKRGERAGCLDPIALGLAKKICCHHELTGQIHTVVMIGALGHGARRHHRWQLQPCLRSKISGVDD